DAIRERVAGRPIQSQPGDRRWISALVARNRGYWFGAGIHHAADDAFATRCRRGSSVSLLLEDPGAASPGAVSRLRQWPNVRRHEVWPGRRNAWRRITDGEIRLAAGVHRNRCAEPALAAGVDALDAAWRRN